MEETLKKLRIYHTQLNMDRGLPSWIIVTFTNGDGQTIYIYTIDYSYDKARDQLYACFNDAVVCDWSFCVRPAPTQHEK